MPLVEGVRVVRGPDYSRTKPRTATVIWDSGVIGEYRGGPKGRYDLRVFKKLILDFLYFQFDEFYF